MCIFELVQMSNVWDSSGWLYINIHAIVLLYNRAIVQDTRKIKLLALLWRLIAKDARQASDQIVAKVSHSSWFVSLLHFEQNDFHLLREKSNGTDAFWQ